ncbi:MAG: hypothetical protein ABEK75_10290 [Salinibacter sp.]
MPSTWSRPVRTVVAGIALLGVLLAAWMASPEDWSPLGASNEGRRAEGRSAASRPFLRAG